MVVETYITTSFFVGLALGCILSYGIATLGMLLQKATINDALKLIKESKQGEVGNNGGLKPNREPKPDKPNL